MNAAFISKGKLYLLSESGTATEVRSEFAAKQEGLAARRQSYSPWSKDSGESAGFGGINVWGGHQAANRFTPYQVTDVAWSSDKTLLYTMTNGTVTGIFELDVADHTERRLVHRNELHFLGMDYDPDQELLCVGRATEDGAAHLEFVDRNGRTVKRLTEGDSVDCNPSFSRRDRSQILFQSSGIARTEDGEFHSFGPSSVNRLNLETGALEEIIGDDAHDFLTPQEGSDGAVYCIRRPLASAMRIPIWKSLIGFLMAPVFFAQALYNFLKIFTQLFKNEPTLAEGPKAPPVPRQQYVRVLGQTIALGKAHADPKSEDASLVPPTWELIRIAPDTPVEVLATSVCTFSLDAPGSITHSNGFKIHIHGSGGNSALGRFEMVEKLRCL